MTDTMAREARMRRALEKYGCGLRKSNARTPHLDDLGGYMIYDLSTNAVVRGPEFEYSLEDVEAYAYE